MRFLRARAVAGLVDQVAFSAQTFAVTFYALHTLGLSEVGHFTLVVTGMTLVQAGVRSLALEPLTIRFVTAERPDQTRAAAHAAGFTSVLALCSIVVGVGVSFVTHSSAWAAGLALAALLVQDTWRFALFSQQRVWAAAMNDWACFVVTAALLAIGDPGTGGFAWILLAWGGGSLLGASLGSWQVGVAPRLRAAPAWFGAQRDIGVPLVGSTLAQQLSGRLSLAITAAVTGYAGLGRLAASRTLLSPSNTVIASTASFAVAGGVRRLAASPAQLVAYTRALSATLSAMVIGLVIVLGVIPLSVGHAIAGHNWEHARSLLIPTGLWVFGMAVNQGARIGLRALEQVGMLFRLSLGLGVLLLASAGTGAVLGGVPGAAWGFGLASIVGQLPFTITYRRALRRHADSLRGQDVGAPA